MLDDPVPDLKRQLAREIMDSVSGENYFIAASVLDLATTRFSKLRHGRLEFFSLDKLVRLLAYVDRRVEISVANVGPKSLRIFAIIGHHRARKKQKSTNRENCSSTSGGTAEPPGNLWRSD